MTCNAMLDNLDHSTSPEASKVLCLVCVHHAVGEMVIFVSKIAILELLKRNFFEHHSRLHACFHRIERILAILLTTSFANLRGELAYSEERGQYAACAS